MMVWHPWLAPFTTQNFHHSGGDPSEKIIFCAKNVLKKDIGIPIEFQRPLFLFGYIRNGCLMLYPQYSHP